MGRQNRQVLWAPSLIYFSIVQLIEYIGNKWIWTRKYREPRRLKFRCYFCCSSCRHTCIAPCHPAYCYLASVLFRGQKTISNCFGIVNRSKKLNILMFISLHKRYTKTIFRYFFKPSDDRNGDVGMCGNIRNYGVPIYHISARVNSKPQI